MSHDRSTHQDDRLGAYHDGALEPREAGRVREHLALCAVCRERLEQIAKLSRSIRALPVEPMPEDLKAAILQRSRAASLPRRTSSWRLTSLAAAAVAVVVAVAIWRGGSTPYVPVRPLDEAPHEDSVTSGPADAVAARPQSPPAPAGDIGLDRPEKERANAESKDKSSAGRARREAAGAYPVREESRVAPLQKEVDEGNEVKEDDDARQRAAAQPDAEAMPPAAMSAPEAPAPTEGSVIARYGTTLVFEGDRPVRLTPIVPRQDHSTRLAAGATQEEGGGASVPSAKSLTARPPAPADSPATITFLVQADLEGRILSADPVGARTRETTMVESARAMLVGSRLVPFPARRAMTVVVEVSLPAF